MAESMRATSLQLSATELKTLTKWNDAVIIEFLSLQAGVRNVTENINIIINNISTLVSLESQSTARVVTLTRAVEVLEEQVHAFDSHESEIHNLKRDLLRAITDNANILASLNSLITKVASNKRDQQRIINNLNEELTSAQARNGRQAAKITLLSDQLLALSEQVEGYHSQIAKQAAKNAAQDDQIQALTEQAAIPDYSLLARLTREIDARIDLQQELAGS